MLPTMYLSSCKSADEGGDRVVGWETWKHVEFSWSLGSKQLDGDMAVRQKEKCDPKKLGLLKVISV